MLLSIPLQSILLATSFNTPPRALDLAAPRPAAFDRLISGGVSLTREFPSASKAGGGVSMMADARVVDADVEKSGGAVN